MSPILTYWTALGSLRYTGGSESDSTAPPGDSASGAAPHRRTFGQGGLGDWRVLGRLQDRAASTARNAVNAQKKTETAHKEKYSVVSGKGKSENREEDSQGTRDNTVSTEKNTVSAQTKKHSAQRESEHREKHRTYTAREHRNEHSQPREKNSVQ